MKFYIVAVVEWCDNERLSKKCTYHTSYKGAVAGALKAIRELRKDGYTMKRYEKHWYATECVRGGEWDASVYIDEAEMMN